MPEYKMVDGARVELPAAEVAALEAERTTAVPARRGIDDKRAAAMVIVQGQVARVRAIAVGSRTPQDRWLLALSYLLCTEE